MRRRSSHRETLREAKEAAYLYALGLSQEKIAEYLYSSTATISRRLKLAREEGFLEDRPVLKLSEEDLQECSRIAFGGELREALHRAVGGYRLRNITIVPSAPKASPEDEVNIPRVGEAAALRLRYHEARGKMHLVGVSWGRTTWATAFAARQLLPPNSAADPPKKAPPEFIPLAGDLLLSPEKGTYTLAASTVAAELTQAFQGNLKKQRYLWAPAYIPFTFLQGDPEQVEAERTTVRRFLESLPPYRQIFGPAEDGKEPLINRLDTILAGAGAFSDKAWWFNLAEHIRPEEKERLAQSAIGDLCGRFIPRRNASKDGIRLIEEINDRVFVPPLEAFTRCAERARREDTPGPILVAEGADKAEVVTHICLEGFVSEIVIDQELAEEMARLLEVEQ
jgi:DNA-binding transcriptional regulator LsrR (DeoR family)